MKAMLPVLLVAGCYLGAQSSALSQLLINGAGATFPYPLYSKWFDEYAKIDPSVRFNYQSIGSGGGQKQILAQTVDFGATDSPMSDENLAKSPVPLLHLPTVAGAVAITFNLPGVSDLSLDGATLADIFLGKITKWNDTRITVLNPGRKFPASDIVVVHRSDGSGTSYIFSDYLSSVSKEWEEVVGRNTSLKWPVGLGAKGNEGLAGQIRQLPDTIGYLELAFAKQNQLRVAAMQNSSGAFVIPSLDSVTEVLRATQVPDDFRFSMVNSPNAKAYPIVSVTWLLVYQHQKDAAKGKKLVEFLRWALTEGESMATVLEYSPLPAPVQKRVLDRIESIKY